MIPIFNLFRPSTMTQTAQRLNYSNIRPPDNSSEEQEDKCKGTDPIHYGGA
jgi:hypothetical protein